jgi:hypothetical protein
MLLINLDDDCITLSQPSATAGYTAATAAMIELIQSCSSGCGPRWRQSDGPWDLRRKTQILFLK